jgi:3-phenylpropionate/trans-cinnamate dioxygenase ferredoxin reductase component
MRDHVVIVGGGVAAMRCAFELRERGFDGRLSMLCAEGTPPYDRTLVSKALIAGDPVGDERLLLQSREAYDDAAIELRLGVRVTALEAADGRLLLADGIRVPYDRLVLAVGGEPARPPQLMADGVVTLRELGDAQRLEPVLGGVERIVIIGGGFIGTEVASMAAARGLDATIVDAALPFAPLLGDRVARRICAMHRARGVTLLTGTPVDRVRRAGPAFWVDLADGRHVPADVVVVAVGMRPATRWLDRSSLRATRGVPVDSGGRTRVAGVYAAGDGALVLDPVTGRYASGEHWDAASRHGALVASSILGLEAPEPRAPYFWSDQLGMKLQMIGRAHGADSVEIEEAAPSPSFIARYRRRGRLVGVFAAGVPRAIGRARRELEGAPESDGAKGLPLPPERVHRRREFAYPDVIEHARLLTPNRAVARYAAETRRTAGKGER